MPNPKVLIVDDEAIVRESISDWLKESGYDVATAESGEEALKMIETQDFNVMMIDLRLPGESGITVLKEVKAKKPDIKSIIITAYPSEETISQAKELGAIDYLIKPLVPDDLEKLINDAVKDIGKVPVKVLIVDDEAIVRESIRDWLKESGYDVATAESGEEALKVIQTQDFNVIVVNLRLPGESGIAVLKKVKAKKPNIKSIIITAYPSDETISKAKELDAVDYLVDYWCLMTSRDLSRILSKMIGRSP